MKVQINNKQARILGTCTGKRLLPGKNTLEISEAELSRIQGNAQFQSWQRLGWVSIVQTGLPAAASPAASAPAAEPKAEDVLAGVTLDDAAGMIAACSDLDLLRAWLENDKRIGAKKAIELRILELTGDGGEEDPEALPDGVDEVFGDVTDEGEEDADAGGSEEG